MGEPFRRRKIKPMPEVIMVTNSCGCIFCDLDLEPYLGQMEPDEVAAYWHDTKSGRVKCTKPRDKE